MPQHMNMRDALRLATKDAHFARDLAANPEMYAKHFHLNDKQIAALKNVADAVHRIPDIGPQADYE